ncbi:MAG: 1-acyl-sn-glycerol-3-phosphate acyltransferase [Nitrosomonas sp.]|nr:MAG: 1-acyl-sn-glycerol-3-phosphate acyltransferase [Nitrosomonas sp.]
MQQQTPVLLQLIRLFRLSFHIASGLIQSVAYPYFSLTVRRNMMQKWASGLLSVLAIKLKCHGEPPGHNISRALLAVNHVSWLDVCILMAICPTRFVAKAEIRQWPILGLLSRNVGTLFIERTKRSDTLRINQQISSTLIQGERVAVFPEGTTTDGMQICHFHASLLQSAVAANALLFPVAVSYKKPSGENCPEAAYVDPSLIASLKKILSQPCIDAELTFTPSLSCGSKNRRELARFAEQAIANTLALPIVHKQSERSHDHPNE